MFQVVFPFFKFFLSLYVILKQFKRQQMAKMNHRVPKERLGTSRFNDVFLKIYPYDPISIFQELEIGSDLTFMQSKIKICKTDFSQTKKM